MNRMAAHRPGHLAGRTDGSRTLTIHHVPTPEGGDGVGGSQGGAGPSSIPDGVLRLRGAGDPNSRRVVWSDDTVDNEHMGKKSSKICCIYHKPRAFDESSSSGSSSGSDSESDSDSASASDSSPASDAEGVSSSSDGPSMSSRMREKVAARKRDNKGKGRSTSSAADHHHDHEEGEGCEHHTHNKKGGVKAKKSSSARKAKTGHRSGRTMVITETEQVQHPAGTGDIGSDKDGQGGQFDADRLARNAYERGPT